MYSYGGFWIRVLAYLIDALIIQFASSFLIALVIGVGFAVDAPDAVGGLAVASVYGLGLVFNWLYFALLESSAWQGTVGKQALKLIVTDEFGERIGFGRATGRYFAKFLSVTIFFVGFFMIGWTQRKRGLHDMIAGTLIYKADSPNLSRNSARVFE